MDYGLWQVSCRRLFYSNKGHKINRTRHNKNELYKGRFYIGVEGNLEKCTFFISMYLTLSQSVQTEENYKTEGKVVYQIHYDYKSIYN
ncbi:hypothetical protein OJ967_01870 [Peribacillus frigoritolerans]|uniref:hypothetical protein n=1 Tax=Peribacillus frigoritolerans TaxID=450367 RepID=UPI002227F277|nr:hypothetical protein [Peribacillus frigoritolerans]UYY99341.1 hypothetical protein OJ967_01870 [Peribacillus frigoritolerans]